MRKMERTEKWIMTHSWITMSWQEIKNDIEKIFNDVVGKKDYGSYHDELSNALINYCFPDDLNTFSDYQDSFELLGRCVAYLTKEKNIKDLMDNTYSWFGRIEFACNHTGFTCSKSSVVFSDRIDDKLPQFIDQIEKMLLYTSFYSSFAKVFWESLTHINRHFV